MKLDAYAKAIIAALFTGVAMFFTLKGDGLSGDDWATIITAALGAGGFTWAVPNAPLKNTSKTTFEVESSGPMPTTGDTWVQTPTGSGWDGDTNTNPGGTPRHLEP